MKRRILLAGGVLLETGDGERRIVHPAHCPICRRKVTAEGDRDHAFTVPDDQVEATVVVDRCHGRSVR